MRILDISLVITFNYTVCIIDPIPFLARLVASLPTNLPTVSITNLYDLISILWVIGFSRRLSQTAVKYSDELFRRKESESLEVHNVE